MRLKSFPPTRARVQQVERIVHRRCGASLNNHRRELRTDSVVRINRVACERMLFRMQSSVDFDADGTFAVPERHAVMPVDECGSRFMRCLPKAERAKLLFKDGLLIR